MSGCQVDDNWEGLTNVLWNIHQNMVSISKSMAKCKINIDTDFTDYTDFHNNY